MPSFTPGGDQLTPFGKNVFLRSTVGVKTESYTVAAATIPQETIDGVAGQKILQSGTVMALITSGPDSGKIGPYQGSGTAEVQTLTESGTISGGTYTITIDGDTTTAIAYDATAATILAALEALDSVVPGDIAVSGGPVHTAPVSITYYGNFIGNVAQLTVDTTNLTGSTPGITVATATPGVAGAADGRQTAANIVGLCDTFMPWQLMEHDDEVAVIYECTAVQSWCYELNAAGERIALSNTTADAMRSVKRMDITFH